MMTMNWIDPSPHPQPWMTGILIAVTVLPEDEAFYAVQATGDEYQ
jgi:hypothetical protein